MSADVCPVCGAAKSPHREGFTCGESSGFSDCENAADIAIVRAAEIKRLKAMLAPKWTDRRAEQLEELRKILGDCSDLNRATHIIERLCRISTGAEALTKSDIGNLEPSFLEFLNTLCRDDRRNQTNQENRT